jgi:hypothetical protein
MGSAEKALVILLRAGAVLLMTALFTAAMPFAWMDATHRWLGMGDLPSGPIVGYLTRSCSLLYAYHGALLFYVSLDVKRYLPIVRFIAILTILFGFAMTVLDYLVGMPKYWILGEGPMIFVLGVVFLLLARETQRQMEDKVST